MEVAAAAAVVAEVAEAAEMYGIHIARISNGTSSYTPKSL